ncbi:MAG: Gfo/Idh/MocA family oxidoreductase [Tidjanibacter sp.]|nr:Gfo/Idh/MocA family oxidoreductase [Tidjanibacter sp.]
MKYRLFLFTILSVLCLTVLLGCSKPNDCSYRISDDKIVYNVPQRAEGQRSALGLTAAPMDTVRVGFIGLGMRGPGAVKRFTFLDGVKIVALCDLYPERVEKSQQILSSRGLEPAAEYSGEEGWKELCSRDDIDLVYICTPWLHHTPMAVYAMEHGKHVAVEVPAAMSIAECWQLVDTSERTQRHCMMLENCVYDFFELTTLNMVQQGLFGEVVHAEGAYIHNLDPFWDEYQGNWRLDYNQKHRGDVYPTHGIGPVCQALNIHRGDRMAYLVSIDSDSFNGRKTAKAKMGVDDFANGDHTATMIRTAKGKTIEIQHDVYTPRPYSRMYQITGTEGFANKYPVEGFALKTENLPSDGKVDIENLDAESYVSDELREELMQEYQHPITRSAELVETAKRVGGHGGMDFIMDYRLVYCLRNGLPLDQDVYDAAEWSCLTELSGVSIAHGSMPVEVPDFTRGDWDKTKGLQFAL